MKVLLINPSLEDNRFEFTKVPPLGLAYIASMLRSANHDVAFFDTALSTDISHDIKQRVTSYKPDIVGITCVTSLFKPAMRILNLIKNLDSTIIKIVGGVHPTLLTNEVLSEDAVDYVILGEGEYTIVELLNAIKTSKEPVGIKGVGYKKDGNHIINEPRPPVEDLDSLPMPAYDIFELNRYYTLHVPRRPFATMITSRGCPYRCIFCCATAVSGKKFRAHSAKNILSQIMHLQKHFQVKSIAFRDSEFTLNIKRVNELCDLLIEKKLNILWSCNSRVGHLGSDILEKMKKAGCYLIQYGVESGSQKILNVLKKDITIDAVRKSFFLTRKAKISSIANFMIGNPYETKEDIEMTIRLAKEIRPDYALFSFAMPFPGTELYAMAVKNDWFIEGHNIYTMRTEHCCINGTNMDTADLKTMLKKAYRSFYFRPSYIIGQLMAFNTYKYAINAGGLLRIANLK